MLTGRAVVGGAPIAELDATATGTDADDNEDTVDALGLEDEPEQPLRQIPPTATTASRRRTSVSLAHPAPG